MGLNGWVKLPRYSRVWPLSPEASWLLAQLLLWMNWEQVELRQWFEFPDAPCKTATRLSTHRLRKARRELQEKHCIDFKAGIAHRCTAYQLLTDGGRGTFPLNTDKASSSVFV